MLGFFPPTLTKKSSNLKPHKHKLGSQKNNQKDNLFMQCLYTLLKWHSLKEHTCKFLHVYRYLYVTCKDLRSVQTINLCIPFLKINLIFLFSKQHFQVHVFNLMRRWWSSIIQNTTTAVIKSDLPLPYICGWLRTDSWTSRSRPAPRTPQWT